MMKPETAAFLIELNRRFYAEFGAAFAATRRRIQPGVDRALTALPDRGEWIDLGCGSGSLAVEWLRWERSSRYLGLDFSPTLLDEARAAVNGLPGYSSRRDRVRFAQADLADPDWSTDVRPVEGELFTGGLCFAVLHHLPSLELRIRVLAQVNRLLPVGGQLVHSVWQFQHSPRLMERRLPWETVGLDPRSLEPGDTLLDWRYALPGQPDQTGLRYVHLFDRVELDALAQSTGFRVLDSYESDGHESRLGLYQVWVKEDPA